MMQETKKNFELPVIEVIRLNGPDIITSSDYNETQESYFSSYDYYKIE